MRAEAGSGTSVGGSPVPPGAVVKSIGVVKGSVGNEVVVGIVNGAEVGGWVMRIVVNGGVVVRRIVVNGGGVVRRTVVNGGAVVRRTVVNGGVVVRRIVVNGGMMIVVSGGTMIDVPGGSSAHAPRDCNKTLQKGEVTIILPSRLSTRRRSRGNILA
jgi:hypothetical protein